MNRLERRRGYDDHTRITLLEDDADAFDNAVGELRDEVRAQSRILMGVLVAVSTGAIIGAINIVLQAS